MTSQKQRTAIAEACGWTVEEGTTVGHAPNGAFLCEIPDYLTDLNAMHEAEKVLKSGTQWMVHVNHLREITGEPKGCELFVFALVSATAAQRAEAFLRTLGKWEEA
jgi:hypothetical protein